MRRRTHGDRNTVEMGENEMGFIAEIKRPHYGGCCRHVTDLPRTKSCFWPKQPKLLNLFIHALMTQITETAENSRSQPGRFGLNHLLCKAVPHIADSAEARGDCKNYICYELTIECIQCRFFKFFSPLLLCFSPLTLVRSPEVYPTIALSQSFSRTHRITFHNLQIALYTCVKHIWVAFFLHENYFFPLLFPWFLRHPELLPRTCAKFPFLLFLARSLR